MKADPRISFKDYLHHKIGRLLQPERGSVTRSRFLKTERLIRI